VARFLVGLRSRAAGDASLRSLLRAKIHKAKVTQADPDYVGSITIDRALLDLVDLWPNEKVLVSSNTSGARLETYVLEGERGSGEICMNGPAAHLIAAGEEIVIMAFEYSDQPVEAKVILVDGQNNFVRFLVEERDQKV
jgi:aspartate 1-decarboxylase